MLFSGWFNCRLPRERWKHETHFTFWLSQQRNLDVLGQEIGINMRLIRTEAPIGKFYLDILAENIDSQRKIVIENQLGLANHDHIGKLITYASALNPEIIILIIHDINEQHQKTIKWLNKISKKNIHFFVVKIELLQIDDSNLAPKFEVIVRPTEWSKITNTNSVSNLLTSSRRLQVEFWENFKNYVAQNNPELRLQYPRASSWRDIHLGSPEAHVVVTINVRENQLGCNLYIRHNKILFHYLKKYQADIDSLLGEPTIWINSNISARIGISKMNDGIFKAENSENFHWICEKANLFQEIFEKYFQRI